MARRGCAVLPALPVLFSEEGAAWWRGRPRRPEQPEVEAGPG